MKGAATGRVAVLASVQKNGAPPERREAPQSPLRDCVIYLSKSSLMDCSKSSALMRQ